MGLLTSIFSFLKIIFSSIFSGVRTFQEWIKYRYGVFPETGFPGDALYPEFYHVGPAMRKNEGCNTTLETNRTDSTILRQMVSVFKQSVVIASFFSCK